MKRECCHAACGQSYIDTGDPGCIAVWKWGAIRNDDGYEHTELVVDAERVWLPCCDSCPGWLVNMSDTVRPDGTSRGLGIERCDECGRFPDDEAVLEYLYMYPVRRWRRGPWGAP